ncbi:serine hydrolase domain-containing protein [Streptomyces thermolilacinus]|uniref:serine hydrolase domain-containing protein n=1 Tax=Streptomyces thermolilacinus TaxID=285540 RepID=UPI00048BC04C|nr:serine hydrolase domain-containing protein [Streptomyces thermolilacinus]
MSKFRTRLVVPLVLAICGLTVSDPPATPPPALTRLVTAGGAPAAALLSETYGPSGTARFRTTGPGIGRADHFRAGSVTKTFVATVVLQLAAERRLALDDPVAARAPGLLPPPLDRRVTVRHLLTHTSGLPDLTRPTGPALPPEGLRAALVSRTAKPPGTFAYSNTNYVVLGRIVEHLTGRSYASEAHRRVIAPLGLTGTSFPGARTTLPDPHGRGYDSAGRDVTALDPRVAGAAGELVSTLADLNRFYSALLDGRLLPPPQLAALLDTSSAHGRYGMGLFPTRLPCGVTVWGHNGRVPGSYVRTAATRDGRHVLTFRANTDTLSPGPPLERALLEAEFCPPAGTAEAPEVSAAAEAPATAAAGRGAAPPYSGTMSGAPSLAASAVWSSGWRWDSRSASTRFS